MPIAAAAILKNAMLSPATDEADRPEMVPPAACLKKKDTRSPAPLSCEALPLDETPVAWTRRMLQAHVLWHCELPVYGGYAKPSLREQVCVLLATSQESSWDFLEMETG